MNPLPVVVRAWYLQVTSDHELPFAGTIRMAMSAFAGWVETNLVDFARGQWGYTTMRTGKFEILGWSDSSRLSVAPSPHDVPRPPKLPCPTKDPYWFPLSKRDRSEHSEETVPW